MTSDSNIQVFSAFSIFSSSIKLPFSVKDFLKACQKLVKLGLTMSFTYLNSALSVDLHTFQQKCNYHHHTGVIQSRTKILYLV